ncbi:MAG: VCBS repeat-containing protein [Planctomycetia bacterium]|nr:VCBS repeat-containing protein [Planctomycetia bacterium]
MTQKNYLILLLGATLIFSSVLNGFSSEPQYQKIIVSTKFHSEGAAVGDFNQDNQLDIVSGHYWYEGPDFQKSHQIYEAEDNFDPEGYSNSFVLFTDDFNGDGWTDVLICPHPGVTGYWYENPQNAEKLWTAHEASIELGNESQTWRDIDGDGQNDLIFNRIGFYGFATFDQNKATEPWTFHPVSEYNDKYQRYYHGNGCGDLNGDGRVDLIEMDGWFEQPENVNDKWPFHPFKFSDAASNILVYDVDNDGLNDIITALHCHLYGLAWFKQVRDETGKIDFVKNIIIPTEPDDDFFPKVSQLHSMELADFNGDGVLDFVTGKRFWAHGSKGDIAANDPALLLWFENKRKADGSVEFVPHLIDDDSGVGTQVTVHDLNGDNVPDIIVGNKKGTFVFLSK